MFLSVCTPAWPACVKRFLQKQEVPADCPLGNQLAPVEKRDKTEVYGGMGRTLYPVGSSWGTMAGRSAGMVSVARTPTAPVISQNNEERRRVQSSSAGPKGEARESATRQREGGRHPAYRSDGMRGRRWLSGSRRGGNLLRWARLSPRRVFQVVGWPGADGFLIRRSADACANSSGVGRGAPHTSSGPRIVRRVVCCHTGGRAGRNVLR